MTNLGCLIFSTTAILTMVIVIAFLSLRMFRLARKIKHLQGDRNRLLEQKTRNQEKNIIMLSSLEKKMILNALNMEVYKNAIQDPATKYVIRETYVLLKKKIKESIFL